MRRRSTQFLSILLVLVVVLAAAGCGKKKSTTSTTTTTAAAATTTEAATTTTEAATTTTSTGETTTSGTSTAASGIGSLANAENCKQLSDLGTAFSSAFEGANGDVQKQAALLKQFADQTPEDIRPDFQTLAAAFTKIADALKGVDISSSSPPDAATLAKLMKLSTEFQDADFQKALTNIETWAANNCHA